MNMIAEDSRQAIDGIWCGTVEVASVHNIRKQDNQRDPSVKMSGSKLYEPPFCFFWFLGKRERFFFVELVVPQGDCSKSV